MDVFCRAALCRQWPRRLFAARPGMWRRVRCRPALHRSGDTSIAQIGLCCLGGPLGCFALFRRFGGEIRTFTAADVITCLLYTSPSPRDAHES
eukprot:2794040-Prymnesium_polylepis.1